LVGSRKSPWRKVLKRPSTGIKVTDWLAERLAQEVDTVFLVYGGAIADLVESLPGRLKYVCPMHEQAAGFMAEGYAKVKGFGVAIATSGPGGHNLVTCIANCYYDSVPCLFITGQVSTKYMRPNPFVRQVGFQETPITDICRPITKYVSCLKKPEEVKQEVEHAIWAARYGRPGPVLLDIPVDIQKCSI
jgi:acetolactate synthase I/II/III large subunit